MVGISSEKNLKIDSGLVNLKNKLQNDQVSHNFAKRASVNFAHGISNVQDNLKSNNLSGLLESDSILVENQGTNNQSSPIKRAILREKSKT